MIMNKHILKLYETKFEVEANRVYFSPGRVNIIGEHTDYTFGLVMPFCIDKGIYAAVGRNDDMMIRVFSENFPLQGIVEIDLNDLDYKRLNNYGDYVLGVIKEFEKQGKTLDYGLNICMASNLPVGGGLSSSAALALLNIKVFSDEYGYDICGIEAVKLAKRVENDFLGVNCGIMDQFVIWHGKSNKAIFLDTLTLDYELLPLELNDHVMVLINSNTTRKLSESKYNERFKETEIILKELKKDFDLECLGRVALEDLDIYLQKLDNHILKKRLRHIVSENDRVKKAKDALLANDIKELGNLISESHRSLRDDYQVSTSVVDEIVETALKSGALGSRMIGGGFGGSTLNLVLKADFEGFINKFRLLYQPRHEEGFLYSIVVAKDGIKRID
jgi:galactokinase